MKILFATDGSDTAQQALTYLQNLPLPADSELTLMTVIEKEIFQGEEEADISADKKATLEQARALLNQSAEELLRISASQVSSYSIGSRLVRFGHPAEEIVKVANQSGIDLVVVGSHGFGGVKRFLLGSVSDQVLLYANCSVLIVRPNPNGQGSGISRLLLAFDDSRPAQRAARFCASLPLTPSTEVTILTVLPLITLFRQDIRQQLGPVWKHKRSRAEGSLAWASRELKWSTRQVNTALHESTDVSQEILDVAEKTASDLIVLGNKGTRAIEQFLLGSSTRRIAQHAPCSVLSVKQRP